jgi:hypothetical protein
MEIENDFVAAAEIIGNALTKKCADVYPEDDSRHKRKNFHSFKIVQNPDVGVEGAAFHSKGSIYLRFIDPHDDRTCHWLIPRQFWEQFATASSETLVSIGLELANRPTYMCAVFAPGKDIAVGIAALWNAVIFDPVTWEREAFTQFFKQRFGVGDIMVDPVSWELWLFPGGDEDLLKDPLFQTMFKILTLAGMLIDEMSKGPITDVKDNTLVGFISAHATIFMFFSQDKTILSDGSSVKGMTVPPEHIWHLITRRLKEVPSFLELMKSSVEAQGKQSALNQLLNRVDPVQFPMETIQVNNMGDMMEMIRSRQREHQLNVQGGPANIDEVFIEKVKELE